MGVSEQGHLISQAAGTISLFPATILIFVRHWAAVQGHAAVVRLLLAVGANPNTQNGDGCTALHLAVEHGAAVVVLRLLDAGAEVHMEDNDGVSVLGLARNSGDARILSLVEADVEPHSHTDD